MTNDHCAEASPSERERCMRKMLRVMAAAFAALVSAAGLVWLSFHPQVHLVRGWSTPVGMVNPCG